MVETMPLDGITLGTIGVAIATIVLAIITFLYMRETRLMRIGSQEPSFSLEPNLYSLAGRFYFLYLFNTGHVGSEIFINCHWNKNTKKFFILSLGTNSRAVLHGIPIAKIVENKINLSMDIEYKNSRGKKVTTQLEIDFSKYLDDNTEFAYQFNYSGNMVETLDEIRKQLRNIDKSLIESVISQKPWLKIISKIKKNPVLIGEKQIVEITVIDPETKIEIIGAITNFKLITSGGSTYINQELLTDEEGKCSIVYDYNQINEIGKYELIVKIVAENYRPKVIKLEFMAIESSNI
jgi:hypothetical protein